MKKWKCTVCGYVHTGEEPPEKCPVCGADKSLFEELPAEIDAGAKRPDSSGVIEGKPTIGGPKKWKCSVCGYVHTGEEPPEKCPVCGADKSLFEPVAEEAAPPRTLSTASTAPVASVASEAEPAEPPSPASTGKQTPYDVVGRYLVTLHAHPISVHIPNGVLPLSVLFMLMALVFEWEPLSTAARYNLAVVMLAMPVVIYTGYNDWRRRFGGHLTSVFRIKIICAGTVGGLTLILSAWWAMDPSLLFSATVGRRLFLFLSFIALGAAALAGYMGGKLVFPNMDDGE